MSGEDSKNVAGLWKSIESLLKDSLDVQNKFDECQRDVSDSSHCPSADIIHLNKVVWPGNAARESHRFNNLDDPHDSLVQGLYTKSQIELDAEAAHPPSPFSQKMARLISDICAEDCDEPRSQNEEKVFVSDEELQASDLHRFDRSFLADKILSQSSAGDEKEVISPQARSVLIGMIDSHIARWVDQNLPEFLEDSLLSSDSRARDAKVKHRS